MKYLGVGQNLLLSILMGWTSIYQLFWGSLGARVLTNRHFSIFWCPAPSDFLRSKPPDLVASSLWGAWQGPMAKKHRVNGRTQLQIIWIQIYFIVHTVIIEDIQELSENRSSIWNGFGRAEKPFQIEDKLIQWPKMVEHPGCWSYFGTLRNHGPGRVQTNIFYLKTI